MKNTLIGVLKRAEEAEIGIFFRFDYGPDPRNAFRVTICYMSVRMDVKLSCLLMENEHELATHIHGTLDRFMGEFEFCIKPKEDE